jgi:methylmalonyl-CoA mutase cobalamin-binding subunit
MSNEDIEELKKMGVGQLFTPGAPMSAISDYIRGWIEKRDATQVAA